MVSPGIFVLGTDTRPLPRSVVTVDTARNVVLEALFSLAQISSHLLRLEAGTSPGAFTINHVESKNFVGTSSSAPSGIILSPATGSSLNFEWNFTLLTPTGPAGSKPAYSVTNVQTKAPLVGNAPAGPRVFLFDILETGPNDAKEVSDLKNENADLKTRNATLTNENAGLKAQVGSLNHDKTNLQTALTNQTATNTACQIKVTQQQCTIDDLRKQIQPLKNTISSNTVTIAQLKAITKYNGHTAKEWESLSRLLWKNARLTLSALHIDYMQFYRRLYWNLPFSYNSARDELDHYDKQGRRHKVAQNYRDPATYGDGRLRWY